MRCDSDVTSHATVAAGENTSGAASVRISQLRRLGACVPSSRLGFLASICSSDLSPYSLTVIPVVVNRRLDRLTSRTLLRGPVTFHRRTPTYNPKRTTKVTLTSLLLDPPFPMMQRITESSQ